MAPLRFGLTLTSFGLLLGLVSEAFALPAHARSATIVERQDVLDEYDYIVAGAGTAGLTVADRLSEDGTCKLVLASKMLVDLNG